MPEGNAWVRIPGSGLAVEGACQVLGVIFWPNDDTDYADIYDGLDATSGKKFCRIESSTSITWCFCFAHPPEFSSGVYVKGVDDDVETTIVFRQ